MRLGEIQVDEAYDDSRVAGGVDLAMDPLLAEIAGPDQPEASGARYGGRQRATRDAAHRSQKDRMAEAEELGERRAEARCRRGHSSSTASASMVISTSSLTTTPPRSSLLFQLTPKTFP